MVENQRILTPATQLHVEDPLEYVAEYHISVAIHSFCAVLHVYVEIFTEIIFHKSLKSLTT